MPLPSRCICSITCVFHAARDRRQHNLRTVGGHTLTALDRQVFRHDQHHLVAADRGRHGERNAGVAARRFDQRIARLDAAAQFGLLDHRQRRAVFHRTRGVVAFELAEDHVIAAADLVVGQADKLYERRIADRVFNRFVSHMGVRCSRCAESSIQRF
jgi:hypothetical protein